MNSECFEYRENHSYKSDFEGITERNDFSGHLFVEQIECVTKLEYLENCKEIKIDEINTLKNISVGILQGEQGTGKISIILSLIRRNKMGIESDFCTKKIYSDLSFLSTKLLGYEKKDTSLVIAEPFVCFEWATEIKRFFPSLKYSVIFSEHEILNQENFTDKDVIICSVKIISILLLNYKFIWKRIIRDSVKTTCSFLSYFLWIVENSLVEYKEDEISTKARTIFYFLEESKKIFPFIHKNIYFIKKPESDQLINPGRYRQLLEPDEKEDEFSVVKNIAIAKNRFFDQKINEHRVDDKRVQVFQRERSKPVLKRCNICFEEGGNIDYKMIFLFCCGYIICDQCIYHYVLDYNFRCPQCRKSIEWSKDVILEDKSIQSSVLKLDTEHDTIYKIIKKITSLPKIFRRSRAFSVSNPIPPPPTSITRSLTQSFTRRTQKYRRILIVTAQPNEVKRELIKKNVNCHISSICYIKNFRYIERILLTFNNNSVLFGKRREFKDKILILSSKINTIGINFQRVTDVIFVNRNNMMSASHVTGVRKSTFYMIENNVRRISGNKKIEFHVLL